MRFECNFCHAELESDVVHEGEEITCPSCGKKIICRDIFQNKNHSNPEIKIVGDPSTKSTPGVASVLDGVTATLGVESLHGFQWRSFFSEVFRHHSRQEIEDYFMVGTSKTTPDIFDVQPEWPKPWMFARCLLSTAIMYMIAYGMCTNFGLRLTSTYTDMIIIGSFSVPLSFTVLFYELNVRRNVSLFQVIKVLFLGGIISIYLLYPLIPVQNFLARTFNVTEQWSAVLAGPIEETAKLITVYFLTRKQRFKYILNGLLYGATVGAGFAVFESAGYAFHVVSRSQDLSQLSDLIMSRALFSPVGHVAYTAITVGAMWRVIGDRSPSLSLLWDWRFMRLFLFGIGLHSFWNSPLLIESFGDGSWYVKMVIVGVLAWLVILSLVQEGLRQIRREQDTIVNAD